MKNCYTCKQDKPLDEFGNNKKSVDGKQPYCKVCGREKDRLHYVANKERQKKIKQRNADAKMRAVNYILEYLKEHPCVDCGESDPIVLDFDHRSDKRNNVTSMLVCSLETIIKEIAKCDVRCANCHRRKTAKQFNYFRYHASVL